MAIPDVGAPPAPVGPGRQPRWQVVVVEIVASVAAVDASVLIVLNYLGAHVTFFGAPVRIDEQHVHHYWALVAALAVAVPVAAGAAVSRRARRALAWHALVAVVGVLVALSFPVTRSGLVQEQPDPSRPERSEPAAPACLSGGDSDECVGG